VVGHVLSLLVPCLVYRIFLHILSSLSLISISASLFAAQAGASRVIAVDASAKMASVATQVSQLFSSHLNPTLCHWITLVYSCVLKLRLLRIMGFYELGMLAMVTSNIRVWSKLSMVWLKTWTNPYRLNPIVLMSY